MIRFLIQVVVVLCFLGFISSSALSQPSVVATSPAVNSIGAAGNTNITIDFSEAMFDFSVSNASIHVQSSMGGYDPATISYDPILFRAELDPVFDFLPGEKVTVILTDEVSSASLVPIVPMVFEFLVGSASAGLNFDSTRTFSVGDRPSCVAVGDFGFDGILDIVAANREDNTISGLSGLGAGDFLAEGTSFCGSLPIGITVADINRSFTPDIITANWGADSISYLTNSGSLMFFQYDHKVTEGNHTVATGDIDGDGWLDVVVATPSDLGILLGNQVSSGFGAYSAFPTGGYYPSHALFADINNDGDQDIIMTHYGLFSPDDTGDVSVFRNDGTGSFGSPEIYRLPKGPVSLVATDLNGDGFLDVAVASIDDDSLRVMLNDGTGLLGTPHGILLALDPVWLVSADLDGDNDIDLITAHDTDGKVSIVTNDGLGNITLFSTLDAGTDINWVDVGDLDQDGDIDLVVAMGSADSVKILFNQGAPAYYCGQFSSGNTGNTDCDTDGKRNLADITRLIDRVYISKAALCLEAEGNTDGDLDEKINLADITKLIDHVYISKAETAPCN